MVGGGAFLAPVEGLVEEGGAVLVGLKVRWRQMGSWRWSVMLR